MRNLAVKIRFLGGRYHGFQIQQNAHSIQAEIEAALFKILGERVSIIGCSRTDTGVSAREYVFNFKTQNSITPFKLMGALNHYLSDDIGVLDCAEVEDSFHSRFNAVKKEYTYRVVNSRAKDPFTIDRSYRYMISILDERLLNDEAQAFVGTHDFSAFCSIGDSVKSHIRTIYSAEVKREGDELVFTFLGDGFLYNMVRIMVGTLLALNEGKFKKGDLQKIIQSKNRKNAGPTAEACGLCLNKVYYEKDIFKK